MHISHTIFLTLFTHLVLANTETYLLSIPKDFLQEEYNKYLNISQHYKLPQPDNAVAKLSPNTDYQLLLPYAVSNSVAFELDLIPFFYIANITDIAETSRDLKFLVKLCWQALNPFDFFISHQYVYEDVPIIKRNHDITVQVPKILITVSYKHDAVALREYADLSRPEFDLDTELSIMLHVGEIGGSFAVIRHSLKSWLLSAVNLPDFMLPLLGFVLSVVVVSVSACGYVYEWLLNC
ncbi:hypothetical protein BABINDRAFT_162828 [Babjeviella inositovora NRRL Y-12698]|uniref:Uncharacterized protein n=1 Tax=Babjeviella inositovora NRRL Y-12698 TaxID=984486 RepID=A0A1E3QL16_9ASCO|nr:uncharacterized protein BABINDRAFT_162828 [Babjeviella inositovora NRRL Y-12698]ODQ78154.1 hypothetical protein BABINDRAFT_162828 [Babjeviella inositovora NRRL Y-12698]